MHDEATTDHIGGASAHADGFGVKCKAGLAIGVGLQAGQITGMVFMYGVLAMTFAQGVEVPTSAHAVATAAVAFFMNVKAVFGIGL
jgi:hypothetical protein